MMFWRLYGGRRFQGSYKGGKWKFDGYTAFNFTAGIHPGRPASEALRAPNPNANVTEGVCTIYTGRNMNIANESGEGDYIRWEGRWWRLDEERRHGILIPHNRYVAVLADLPIADLVPTADVFARIFGQGEVLGQGSWAIGQPATLNAVAAAGWEFVEWIRRDEGEEKIATPSYTFNVPERGLVIECHFKEENSTLPITM